MGAPYVGILNKLNKINLIKGVDKKSNYYNLYVISNPAIAEIGDEKHLDVEWLLSNNIDLVIVSAFPTKPDNLIKMEEKGIKVLCLPEWMENSPLARAEWIKVFGALTNQTDLSNEIFKTIKHNYQYLVNEYKTDTTYKSVLMGNNFKGTWYTPGGKSYMANLVYDAGGNYYWSKDTSTGSLSVSFEEVLANQQNADIWINPDRYNSINDLISDDSRYKYFKAVKTHKVYANTKRISKTGGNDFWESGIIMPEVILSDIHTILFDDEVYHEDLYFYKQLP
jgi:iron complex transport system substrate-binding protein